MLVSYQSKFGRVSYVRWRRDSDWPAEHDALLLAQAALGKSAREIAAMLGRQRNSVCGRAHRLARKLGLPPIWSYRPGQRPNGQKHFPPGKSHAEVMARRFPEAKAPAARRARTQAPVIEHPPPPPGSVSLVMLHADGCRWPFGTGPYAFCGCTVVSGRPYCDWHDRQSIDWVAMKKYGR